MQRLVALVQTKGRKLIDRVRRELARRFALKLTLEGYVMVAAMLLIGLAALNTAAPLLYLMFSMMCAFFVLSALLATNTIRSLDVTRDMPRVWLAGVPLPVNLRIINEKLMTSSYSLRVLDRIDSETPIGGVFFDRVPPRGVPVAQEYEALFLKRGNYKLRTVDIATRFPFGLIERILTCNVQSDVLILPQSISVDAAMEAARSELGEYETNRKGTGMGLYGLREYTPDLPAKDIHWKVSARRGALVAREFESEEKRRACVILDNCVPTEARTRRADEMERAIVLASSVIEWLTMHDHEVELRTASGLVGFGSGETHLNRCRRALAELTMVDESPLTRNLLAGSAPGIFVIRVTMGDAALGGPGELVLRTKDFDADLRRAFQPPAIVDQPAPSMSGGFRAGEASA